MADQYDSRVRMVRMDDGVRLRTWTTGSPAGRPAVLLVHGGPGLWDYLEPVAALLEPLTTVHRFDQRGCGGSEESDEHTFTRYFSDVETLRRHWGHERWVVIGHSFGATLALAYAVSYPRRTAALGYLSGVGVGDWRTAYRAESRRRMTPAQQHRLTVLSASDTRTAAEEIEFRALCWFTDYADPVEGWRLAVADARRPERINAVANRLLSAEGRDWESPRILDRLGGLDVPARFIHGTADPRPGETVRRLAAAVPGAEFRLLDGAGHEPWIERRELLRAELAELLDATPCGGDR